MAIAVDRALRRATRQSVEFETFYASGFQTIYRATLAFSNSPEVANDATQEAFVRAFARWRRLKDQQWAIGWVMTTALNVARKLQKDDRKIQEGVRAVTSSDSNHVVIERIDLVSKLSALPPRQKQAVVLHYIGGFQIGEIAELMSLSVGGVKSHLFKARQALRRHELERRPGEHK